MLLRSISFLSCFFLPATVAYAENEVKPVRSMGDFARDLLTPVHTLGQFITTSSTILGVFCCFLGFLQFLDYRKNAYNVPLSSVFAMVIPGVLFITLPFLPIIIGAGITTPQS